MTDEEMMEVWFAEDRSANGIVEGIQKFGRRIAEIEREECAKVCDMSEQTASLRSWQNAYRYAAAAIRARGEK